MKNLMKKGNNVDVQWWERIEENMGNFKIEKIRFEEERIIEKKVEIYGIKIEEENIRILKESDKNRGIYEKMRIIIENLDDKMEEGELMMRFEVMMMEEIGLGMEIKE